MMERPVTRVAVADPEILFHESLSEREILLLGLEVGRTSVIVWFDDGTVEAIVVSVERDLSVLQRALHDIDPSISVEIAPDREAIVLRGLVEDLSYFRLAENTASRYLQARGRETGRDAATTGFVKPGEEGSEIQVREEASTGPRQQDVAVINLIQLRTLPPLIEHQIEEAIHTVGAPDVEVLRERRGPLPDDASDLLILRGTVRDQVTLTRVLNVAAGMFLGKELAAEDLQVVADESGALATGSDAAGGQSGGSNAILQGFQNTSTSGLFGGNQTRLGNRVHANLARAKVISLAQGRILSFLEVKDLPQVRVNIRLYEINRTDLLTYAPNFTALFSDFDQPSLNPAAGASAVQGRNAARVGTFSGTDVQNVLSFLADGFTQQFQVSGEHVAVDAVFRVLESRDLARSLSSPSLTVLSGEQALFQVGGEVPIPQSFSPAFGTPDAAAGTTPGVFSSVEFRAFGVQLSVRPLVDEHDMITLDVITQVAQPDQALTTVIRETTGADLATTAFESRALGTSSRLEDGGVLLIGGLIGRTSSDATSYTPWLHEIPLLGWLFKRFNIRDEDQELVVVVNPVLVREPIPEVRLWSFENPVDALLDHYRVDPTPPARDEREVASAGVDPSEARRDAPGPGSAPSRAREVPASGKIP
jgi:Flp pilus assembly secretin CpaC